MFVPIPVLIVLGLVILGLATLLLSRRGDRGQDLMRPPAPSPHRAPSQPTAFAPPEGETPEALTAEIRLLLERGRKIEAIKLLRDHQPGIGLKEAKDWVERVEAGEA